jgi:hypothetical protein
MNLGGILMMGIGMVFLAIGFIFLPIATDATQDLLDYSYTGYTATAITDATYTGYTAVVGITPILILVGYLAAAVITGFLGFKVMKGAGESNFNPGNIMLLGLSIVFIAIGLIVQPVLLDGVSTAYTQRAPQTDIEAVTTLNYTTGNVTLAYELWNNSTAEVLSVSTNKTGNVLAVVSYNTTDNHLLLSGLSANTTHRITTNYNNAGLLDGTTGFTGFSALLGIAPMLVHIAFIAAAVFSGFFGITRLASSD